MTITKSILVGLNTIALGALLGCATPQVGERLPPLTSQQMTWVQKLVSNQLRDPDSAQFRNVRAIGTKDTLYVCGEVNARNSFGGYTGHVPFIVSSPKKRGRVAVDIANEATQAGMVGFLIVYPICR